MKIVSSPQSHLQLYSRTSQSTQSHS